MTCELSPGDSPHAELHMMVMSVLSYTPREVKLSAERVGDTVPWKRLERWVNGCLLLFDLGCYEFHLFDRIDYNGGSFLSRAKANFNPVIVSTNRAWRGRAVDVTATRAVRWQVEAPAPNTGCSSRSIQ